MNAELLLQHFKRLSEAPDAIPRLRRFILDLAVRGKLVEQNPNDEPAEELLNRIQEEKAKLIAEGGRSRKQSRLSQSLKNRNHLSYLKVGGGCGLVMFHSRLLMGSISPEQNIIRHAVADKRCN